MYHASGEVNDWLMVNSCCCVSCVSIHYVSQKNVMSYFYSVVWARFPGWFNLSRINDFETFDALQKISQYKLS